VDARFTFWLPVQDLRCAALGDGAIAAAWTAPHGEHNNADSYTRGRIEPVLSNAAGATTDNPRQERLTLIIPDIDDRTIRTVFDRSLGPLQPVGRTRPRLSMSSCWMRKAG